MVDGRRVRRLLQRVSDDLAYLHRQSHLDRTMLVQDFERLAALKYVFLTAIEGCLDVAQHLCASEGWGPPESNADAIRVLGRHAVLDAGLAEVMARAVGFRNLLVHRYVDIDDEKVVGFLDRLDDLTGFVAEVATWVESNP